MNPSRRRLVLIWLATSAAVAIFALIGYRSLARVPELAGRTAPETLLADPTALFADPGMIGTAVEIRVTRAIDSCMQARGFDYRGPAAVEGLDQVLEPAIDGYGISTGPAGAAVTLGDGGAGRFERDAYEQALYGSTLGGGGSSGGCAAVGAAELDAAMATIEAMPYSIAQLEADTLAHPDMVAGLAAWSSCMAGKGYTASSPVDLIADIVDRLSRATPEEATALIDEERRTAVADYACRDQHLSPAVVSVAAELAPAFVTANQEQLEGLMPPEPAEWEGVTVPTDLGTGDVQVTLLWSSSADLDLSVTDPEGFSVNFGSRSSPTGGMLDRDANRSCSENVPDPVENVFWAPGEAPRGSYSVRVNMYAACSTPLPIEFTLVVRVGGRTLISETVSLDGGSWTTEFSY
ncbi:MAG: hypothetical protein MUP76_10050 [Acidimicrobiia bacterium]|nr:hypothetical protein [Acidimicrobiia bacterium]